MRTYAVKWREPDGRTFVGRLALGRRTLRLDGRRRGADEPAVNRQFGYEELRSLRIANRGAERLDGRPALVVERPDGDYLVSDAGMGAPIVQELVDRLVVLRLAASCKATVVMPIEDGVIEQVRELVSDGPPFDPADTPLTRHELFLTPREAIFVFEAATADGLRELVSRLDIWAAAAPWGLFVAGPPRVADLVYAWERPEPYVVPAADTGR